MPVPSWLSELWSRDSLLSSTFAGGLVGNLVASVLFAAGKRTLQPVLDLVPKLVELLTTGGRDAGHEILRAVRRAECDVMVKLCDQALADDHGLLPGAGFRNHSDPDVAALCQIRDASWQTGKRLETMPVDELTSLHGTALTNVPTLIHAGSECLTVDHPDDLRGRVVGEQLAALEAAAPAGLPQSLRDRITKHPNGWWDLIRVAFRAELQDPTNARLRNAWELDVLSLLSDVLGKTHAEFEQRVAGTDIEATRVWSELAELRRAADHARGRLDEILDGVRSLLTRFGVTDPRATTIPFDVPPRAFAGTFFGRQALLADLTDRLRRGEDVCVWGPAGMGKTALAAEAIREVIGETEESLPDSPYPEGVVLLDLYKLPGLPTSAWERLVAVFEPSARSDGSARERAERACHGRRALVVVEAAEEAGSGHALQDLLSVLALESTRLVLTRSKAQIFTGDPFDVGTELSPGDATSLLTKLAGHRTPASVLASVVERLGGHPLALTWAGAQLASGEQEPQTFVAALERTDLPSLVHRPGDEQQTLRWLYERSVAHLSADARRVLAAAGLLAVGAIPFGAAAAVLGEDDRAAASERARAALGILVRHGLLFQRTGGDGLWEFTHVLVHQFAQGTPLPDRADVLDSLSVWAYLALDRAAADAQRSGGMALLDVIAQHVVAILLQPTDALEPFARALVDDVHDPLVALGRIDVAVTLLQGVLGWMDRRPAAPDELPARHHRRAGYLLLLGRGLRMQGRLEEAATACEQALAMRRRRAEAEPEDGSRRHEVTLALEGLGNARHAQGRLPEALVAYEEALTLTRRLAEAEPAETVHQHNVATFVGHVESVLAAQGRLEDARETYEASVEVMRRLALADADSAVSRRGLALSLAQAGDAWRALGEWDDALAAYGEALAIQRGLAETEPDNPEPQRCVAAVLDAIGYVRRAQDRTAEALDLHRQALDIRRRLAAAAPQNAERQREVADSLDDVGDSLCLRGRIREASRVCEEGLAIRRRLTAADPRNAAKQADVARSLDKIGNLNLLGEPKKAADAYEEALALLRRLAEAEPQNAEIQRRMARALNHLWGVWPGLGRRPDARRASEEALAIRRRLADLDPQNRSRQHDLAYELRQQALNRDMLLPRRGRRATARRFAEESLAIHERLAAVDPADSHWQNEVRLSRGMVWRLRGSFEAPDVYRVPWLRPRAPTFLI